MNIKEALQILIENRVSISQNEIYSPGWYLFAAKDKEHATLDGEFTVEELEAITTWMKTEDE